MRNDGKKKHASAVPWSRTIHTVLRSSHSASARASPTSSQEKKKNPERPKRQTSGSLCHIDQHDKPSNAPTRVRKDGEIYPARG
jgi:hypothetical protein